MLLLGLFRMFAAGQYERRSANVGSSVFMVLEAILLVFAVIMTYQAYKREGS